MAASASSTQSAKEFVPKSWAEDLQSYRATRGSQSQATLSQTTAPKRFTRTNMVPFNSIRHPLYAYNDLPSADGGTRTMQDSEVSSTRSFRHGWGDVSLLKQDGYEGVLHPRGVSTGRQGIAAVGLPPRDDGRTDLFGVLNWSEAGQPDGWIGNMHIDPTKGKRPVAQWPDSKGRTDLYETIQRRNPGVPADDAWIGNPHLGPSGGKAHVPETWRGRAGLHDIIQQSILVDPRRSELMKKNADPQCDAWIGNKGMRPHEGRAVVEGKGETLRGAAFATPTPPGWSDLRRRHTHLVPAPVSDVVYEVIQGSAPIPGADRPQRRPLPVHLGEPAIVRSDNLYNHLTYRPLNEVEKKVYSSSWTDSGPSGRKNPPQPGAEGNGKGKDMLVWHPEQQLGSFVPRGGLMQDGRRTKGPQAKVQGGTIRGGAAVARF